MKSAISSKPFLLHCERNATIYYDIRLFFFEFLLINASYGVNSKQKDRIAYTIVSMPSVYDNGSLMLLEWGIP